MHKTYILSIDGVVTLGNKKDSLGDRMKGYENITRNYLTRRIPAIIRVDGKAFHTFTKGMQKPFDRVLMSAMQSTMKYLCERVQGCVFGYTQSDEITLVLTDYATINTDAWFGYNIQKICSVTASMATLGFDQSYKAALHSMETSDAKYLMTLASKVETAMFDARVFSVPRDEVCNCLIWRQKDATRNSIESVGQAYFSQTELHGKSCNAIQDMLWKDRNVNWNLFPTDCKRGACCFKVTTEEQILLPGTEQPTTATRNKWVIDREIPIFTQDRGYIEKWI